MILRTLLAGSLAFGTQATAPEPPAITWKSCPSYSDDVLRSLRLAEKDWPRFRALLARTECGTLSVPQNYADPGGKQITIALTRLKATGKSLGSIAVNPGGPGGSGYLMPHDLAMNGMELNDRYDVIGFDPRGVGYSTKVSCRFDGQEAPDGPITEEFAKKGYDQTVAANRACVATDPAFVGQITTANIARDLDRVRAALGEPKLSFLGVSWGTSLGAVYRSLFPGRVHRMWLDSVAYPGSRMDVFTDVRAMATDRNFQRMAAWIAARHDKYGFGATKAEVASALNRLREKYEADPITFTDIDLTVDGMLISEAAGQSSEDWPDVAQVLKELVDATGPEAPPALKALAGGGGPPPEGAPERQNRTANVAVFCNQDVGPRTFEPAWKAYQERVRRYPVTGPVTTPVPLCAGWPLPPKPKKLRPGGGSLVLSGHLHESLSPYEWTLKTRDVIGGHVLTIDDDQHGSALEKSEHVAKIVDYFETGRLPRR